MSNIATQFGHLDIWQYEVQNVHIGTFHDISRHFTTRKITISALQQPQTTLSGSLLTTW
ncbi:hypothetical protein LJC37_03225 [Bacteroidales bacterium OttesenSCG-928-E04]|nr:hypothetical protein [Bacteroidales bacterium OttesenSCG-928-E04]